MLNIDIAADTELGQQAIELMSGYFQKYPLEDYVKAGNKSLTERDWPVSRAQVKGLRQIAGNEPAKLKDFTDKQAEKNKKALLEIENELKDNKRKRDHRPNDEYLVEQKEKLEKRKKLAQGRVEFWTVVKKAADSLKQGYQASSDHYAAFFQRLCIHYLYVISKRTTGE